MNLEQSLEELSKLPVNNFSHVLDYFNLDKNDKLGGNCILKSKQVKSLVDQCENWYSYIIRTTVGYHHANILMSLDNTYFFDSCIGQLRPINLLKLCQGKVVHRSCFYAQSCIEAEYYDFDSDIFSVNLRLFNQIKWKSLFSMSSVSKGVFNDYDMDQVRMVLPPKFYFRYYDSLTHDSGMKVVMLDTASFNLQIGLPLTNAFKDFETADKLDFEMSVGFSIEELLFYMHTAIENYPYLIDSLRS